MVNEAIEVEWVVTDVLKWWKYKIQLTEMNLEVTAYAAWKMKKNRIRIIPGDIVTVELNAYEPTQWRIVYRKINVDIKKASHNDIVDIDSMFAIDVSPEKTEDDEFL